MDDCLWTFRTKNFTVKWTVSPCDYLDLSWDDDGSTREGLENGRYIAFDSEIAVYFKGNKIAADYLGQSIYENVEDFRDHFGCAGKGGSYFSDMVREAISQARSYLKSAQNIEVRA